MVTSAVYHCSRHLLATQNKYRVGAIFKVFNTTISRSINLSSGSVKQIHSITKYGCTSGKVKSARSSWNVFYSTAAPNVSRSSSSEFNNSGSSGEEDSTIEKIRIRLPWTERMPKLAYLLTNVIRPEECQRYIDTTKQIGYKSVEDGITSGSVCLWESDEESKGLLKAIGPHVPKRWYTGTSLKGFHTKLIFERFEPGEQSCAHRHGALRRGYEDISYLTFILFLNDVDIGGVTSLVSPPMCDHLNGIPVAQSQERVKIRPMAGSVLVFQNDVFHENEQQLSRSKYTLKGEVLYTTAPKYVGNVGVQKSSALSGDLDCNVIKPATWFSDKPGGPTKSTSKPTGIPFYVPQKKEFIYLE